MSDPDDPSGFAVAFAVGCLILLALLAATWLAR